MGQAYNLTPGDFIFGSHRSHGEILAKGLSSIEKLVEAALLHNSGTLGDLLSLAQACESNDDDAFDRAANALQLSSPQINGAHLQALAWADHIGDGI